MKMSVSVFLCICLYVCLSD